jgi:hypothetical protein
MEGRASSPFKGPRGRTAQGEAVCASRPRPSARQPPELQALVSIYAQGHPSQGIKISRVLEHLKDSILF